MSKIKNSLGISKLRFVLLVLVITILSLIFSQASFASNHSKQNEDKKIVLISMPRVTWELYKQANTPNIDKLIDKGSVAALSVRTLTPVTSPSEGYATIAAGSRASAADTSTTTFLNPNEVYDGQLAKDIYKYQRGSYTITNPAAISLGYQASINANSKGLYKSQLGSFAKALTKDSKSIAVFGNADTCNSESPGCFERSIAYLGANQKGIVRYGDVSKDLLIDSSATGKDLYRFDNSKVARLASDSIKKHDVTAVECSDLERVDGLKKQTSPSVYERSFRRTIEKCDELVGLIKKNIDLTKDQIYIFSPSAPSGQEQTTMFLAAGKDINKGLASSATTRRSGIVTLVDIAPSVLKSLSVKIPSSMGNTLMSYNHDSSNSRARIDKLTTLNDKAIIISKSVKPLTNYLIVFALLTILVNLLALSRGGKLKTASSFLGYGLMSVPVVSYLIQPITIALEKPFRFILAISVIVSIISLVSNYLQIKYGSTKVILTLMSINLLVLIADVLTGGNLQFNSIYGSSPIVAGRFTGFGNQPFAVLAISSVLLVSMALNLDFKNDYKKIKIVKISLCILLIAIALIDGAPYFGSDVGGVLAFVPTIFVIAMLLFDKRITLKTIVISTISTILTVSILALLDLSRPASQRTHLGRFAQSIFDGGAVSTLERKLAANFRILTGSMWIFVVLFSIAYLLYVVYSNRQIISDLMNNYRGFKIFYVGGITIALLGMFLNDSGVGIPATMFIIAIPVLSQLIFETQDKEKNKLQGR
ncbi:MAG: hypothetical protein U0R17_04885 [Acidimicrobiia bacterium]